MCDTKIALNSQAPSGTDRIICRDLCTINILTTVNLASTASADHFVAFKYHKKQFIIATSSGIAARRHVARNLTKEKLKQLRSKKTDWMTKMQVLYDAGFRNCPASGVPVFNARKAPRGVKRFLEKLARSINKPSVENSTAMMKACDELKAAFSARLTEGETSAEATAEMEVETEAVMAD